MIILYAIVVIQYYIDIHYHKILYQISNFFKKKICQKSYSTTLFLLYSKKISNAIIYFSITRNLVKKIHIPSNFILYYSYQKNDNVFSYNRLCYNKLWYSRIILAIWENY